MGALERSDYFTRRSRILLGQFDWALGRVREVLDTRYGVGHTSAIIADGRTEFGVLLRELPYIGGKQPFTQFIICTGWFLSMYRVLKRRGASLEEAGSLAYDASRAFMRRVPRLAARFVGRISFSPRYQRRLAERAEQSKARQYPGDFVYEYVKGDGGAFDYGVDYLECGNCKLLAAQGALELAPYLCAVDKVYSEAFGWGLTRTKTIAGGYERCDFRFKRGGLTHVVSKEMGWE